MSQADTEVTGLPNVCKVCRTRIAEKSIPFYCAKSSEMRPGVVPIYTFSTPVCNACIEERTKRRTRNYWRVALAVFAVVFIAVFIAVWKSLAGGKGSGQFQVALLVAGFAGGFILLLALIISTQACSSQFVAVQLAVKDREAELRAAGYAGFWNIPPKNLTIR
jgi:hypothetical protein